MRPSWVEIDLAAIAHNVGAFARLLSPSRLCAVVKADAYGHGDVPVAATALEAGAEWLAVALVEEGIRLREAGIEAPILLLSEPFMGDEALAVEWKLTPTIYRHAMLEAFAQVAPPGSAIHLKVDTGMHRVGAPAGTLRNLARQAASLGLRVEGAWTHFAVAEDDAEFTADQTETFSRAVRGLDIELRHLANTAGTINHPVARADMARVGLGIYGLYPSPDLRPLVSLRPAMSVRSRVSHVSRLPAGSRPSYGRIRPLERDTTVATVPIGYADGVPRLLSTTGGEVLIGGARRPLAGSVTMDQIVVDCGDDDVVIGDEVVLIGRQGGAEIGADEWADRTHTISYEIVCGMGPRLPRRYLD
jgi:alanine racemase